MSRRIVLFGLITVTILTAALLWGRHFLPYEVAEPIGLREDLPAIRNRVLPDLQADYAESGFALGAPVYIRIFKEEAELELWVEQEDRYGLFRTYPICNYSGNLGPKLREGDRQSPEGFYNVDLSALNPRSRFHLSFNLGFPNAYDRTQDRTGSFLMVHGDCRSVGCYAMTDAGIEEIYLSVEAALKAGQAAVPVHAFPFRMTLPRLIRENSHPWIGFWQQLAPAYTHFETTRQPPVVQVLHGRYALVTG